MASCSSAGQQGAAALNLGLAPLSHRAPWADQDDQHTVLGFWEYGAGTDPSAELVGKRLRRVRGPGEGGGSDSIRLELEDGSRYAVRMRGAARACRYSRYEVGFRAGVAPDEASCCTAWCGTAGGPPAPRIEDAALLLVADASPIVWDAGRRTDSGHVELGIKFDCDPAWYRVQGKEVELEEGPLGEAEPLRQSWRDVVLEREERGGSGRATPEGEYGRVDRCG